MTYLTHSTNDEDIFMLGFTEHALPLGHFYITFMSQVLPDVAEASWQLLVLITTANFPDVMMPGYLPP